MKTPRLYYKLAIFLVNPFSVQILIKKIYFEYDKVSTRKITQIGIRPTKNFHIFIQLIRLTLSSGNLYVPKTSNQSNVNITVNRQALIPSTDLHPCVRGAVAEIWVKMLYFFVFFYWRKFILKVCLITFLKIMSLQAR